MKMPIDLYSLTPAERTLFDGSPNATHPNHTITFVGFLLVQTQRYSLP